MREIGIVKWFGNYNSKTGRNNDYGFIAREGKPDIYVHRTQINCPELALSEGTPVTFEVGINPQNDREQAIRLRLLAEETDIEIIERCARSRDRRLWKPVFKNYISTLSSDEYKILILEKITNISLVEKDYFIHYLPEEVWQNFLANNIQNILTPDDYIKLWLNLLHNPNISIDCCHLSIIDV